MFKSILLSFCTIILMGAQRQVKDRNVKQVKEIDISRSVSLENSLLAEKSFINGQKTYFANGHSLEWTEDTENGTYDGVNNKVRVSELKLVYLLQ